MCGLHCLQTTDCIGYNYRFSSNECQPLPVHFAQNDNLTHLNGGSVTLFTTVAEAGFVTYARTY